MLHILGAGSIGLLWAARLQQAGLDCRLIMRPTTLQNWQAGGNRLQLEQDGQIRSLHISAESANTRQPIEKLIVATKAYAVESALTSIAHRLTPTTSILLLQNGLGSQQATSQAYPHQHILYASTTDGAWMRSANHLVWAGQGETRIGSTSKRPAPAWLEQLGAAGINWHWEPQIMHVLWLKLALNCAINPFTVLHDCRNGDVPLYAAESLKLLITELHTLLQTQGLAISHAQLAERIKAVISATSANSSSMRQDVHAGRRTEIDFMLGHACRQARLAGLSTPVLEQLHNALRSHLSKLGLPAD